MSTQAVQKRACPQGTKATPAGEAIKHTSHVEKDEVVAGAAAVVGVVVDPVVHWQLRSYYRASSRR